SALSRARRENAREHTLALKGLLRIRRYQQETPYAFQKVELFFWLRFGEAHSALRGWRPIPAALPSHSILLVPGPKNFPSNYPTAFAVPHPGAQNSPDRPRSISKTM